jgi:outer membrane protein assembly factor BamE
MWLFPAPRRAANMRRTSKTVPGLMRVVSLCLIAFALVAQSACSIPKPGLPRVHKVTVQQGNVITQEMIDRLRPGMTRAQVAYVMGEPVFRNPFDDSRWDYIYTLQIPGYYEDAKRMSLYFENNVLAYFTGDYAPTDAVPEQSTASSGEGPAVSPES